MKVPDEMGVPEMVIVFAAQATVTPKGRFVGVPIPVAPVVEWVILVRTVLTHSVGADEATPTVLAGVTMIVPVAFTLPHPPMSGME